MTEFKYPSDVYSKIDGWFDFQAVYENIARRIIESNIYEPKIVEVGSWLGKSTRYMAELLMQNNILSRFFVVDTFAGSPGEHKVDNPHEQFNKFMDNLRIDPPVDKWVYPIRRTSIEAAKMFKTRSVSAVFIDAEHTFESVFSDLEVWYPKLIENAQFYGHDIFWGEVRLAVENFCSVHDLEYEIQDTCWKIEL